MGQLKHIQKDTGNDRLKSAISQRLSDQHFPSFRDLEVEVDHGLVTISGTVQSYYRRQIALSTCQQLADVITVIDMITVSQ